MAALALALPGAIVSGNNLLFFVVGLLSALCALSRGVGVMMLWRLQLAPAAASARLPRVGKASHLVLWLRHRGHLLPAYGLGGSLTLVGDQHREQVDLDPLLVLLPRQQQLLQLQWLPQRRGLLQPQQLRLCSAAPFGLLAQARTLAAAALPPLWCAPAAVDVGHAVGPLQSQLGSAPLSQAGAGEEFFSLRPYRSGDDVRRIAWRRSARSGRALVVEPEAVVARDLLLCLQLQRAADPALQEHAIACFCSLGEALLAAGFGVAVYSHGLVLGLRRGAAGRRGLLLGCARLNPRAPLPPLPRQLGALPQVAFAGAGLTARAGRNRHALALPPPPATVQGQRA